MLVQHLIEICRRGINAISKEKTYKYYRLLNYGNSCFSPKKNEKFDI